MECAFDAQNLISISLRKIQSSRTQRGGIKLHKNLLVTYVLRNARQFYVSKNLSQTQRIPNYYDDGSAVHHKHLGLTELADDLYCNFESDSWHCGAHQPGGAQPAAELAHQDASACATDAPTDSDLDACWSCADKSSWELPIPNSQANQKTVLDLDTHVVTTVTNGYFQSDCCAQPRQPQGALHCYGKKRKMTAEPSFHLVDPDFYLCDFAPVPCKRLRTDDDALSDSEHLDFSNLISVLGSGGLCEFVSWQHSDLEHILTTQTICLKQTLLSGSGWTRAIEAF